MVRLRTFSAILLVCWSLVVMPGLCSGGLLLHPCECGHSEESGEDECGHEAECASDPCGVVIARNGSQEDGADLQIPDQSPHLFQPISDELRISAAAWASPPPLISPLTSLCSLTTIVLLI